MEFANLIVIFTFYIDYNEKISHGKYASATKTLKLPSSLNVAIVTQK